MMRKKLSWSWICGICLSNFFEHYDTALFGFLSPFLAPLIFPHYDPLIALILTYAMIPLGMCARPIGAIVFGYIGGVYGRKRALIFSLTGMSIVSGCIALIPTYEKVGILSPLIFCFGRLMQNFMASGEVMGGAVFLLENSDSKRHDYLSSIFSASTIGGILLASTGVALLSRLEYIEWGWRILYLLGSLTAAFGCFLRQQMTFEELQVPAKQFYDLHPPKKAINSLFHTFWQYRVPLFMIMVGSGFSYATYSISLVLLNGFIPLVSSFSKEEMISLNTLLLILDFCFLPLFGWIAFRISRERLMLLASLAVVITGIPLFLVLEGATLPVLIGVRVCFVLFGVAFCAPFHAWTQQLVPESKRYLLLSFGYAIGSQVLGGPTAALSLWIFKKTDIIASVAWYWIVLALISSFMLRIKQPVEKEIAIH